MNCKGFELVAAVSLERRFARPDQPDDASNSAAARRPLRSAPSMVANQVSSVCSPAKAIAPSGRASSGSNPPRSRVE